MSTIAKAVVGLVEIAAGVVLDSFTGGVGGNWLIAMGAETPPIYVGFTNDGGSGAAA